MTNHVFSYFQPLFSEMPRISLLPILRKAFSSRSKRHHSAGHPWAALVAFDAALCAAMLKFQYVAVGNEASADAGNGIFLERTKDGKAR